MQEIKLSGKRGQGKVALVSDLDYERVNAQSWHLVPKGYAVAGIRDRVKRHRRNTTSMHRFILGCVVGDGLRADHINREKLDNRRENLRIVTVSQSLRNRGKFKNSKSRFKGVAWDKSTSKWKVVFSLGQYDSEEEAARVYQWATEQLVGNDHLLKIPDDYAIYIDEI